MSARRFERRERLDQVRDIATQAVSLRICCARIGVSYGYGRQLVAIGKFPLPELKKLARRGRHRYSTATIERYLTANETAGVR